MGDLYYSLLAHLQLALLPVRRFLRRVPFPRQAAHRVGSRIRRGLLPKGPATWVKVQSGFAQGIWLRLNLVSEGTYWLGSYEPDVQQVLDRLVSRGCIAYDVGAYVGFFSLALARRVGPDGKVVAFEADPESFIRLRENAERNHVEDRVQTIQAAVWSHPSLSGIPFRRGSHPRSWGGVAADGNAPVLADGETISVPSISLDSFVQQGSPLPDVVKIDVEGGECEVLKGGEGLFSQFHPALVCEVHHEQAARWIEDWLEAKGYHAQWFVPQELFPRTLIALGRRASLLPGSPDGGSRKRQ